MDAELENLSHRVSALEEKVGQTKRLSGPSGKRRKSARYRTAATILGMPLFDLAVGPAPERGEARGYARGFFAIGDVATGVFALGGIARGIVALGGVAFGVFAAGGVAAGLATAAGGVAAGALAAGGVALGLKAAGGVAIGADVAGGLAVKL